MNIHHLVELKKELDHIFESGANEIRVLEMVDKFIQKRYITKEVYGMAYEAGFKEGFNQALRRIKN